MSTESRIVDSSGKPFTVEDAIIVPVDDVETRQLALLTDIAGSPLASIKSYAEARESIMAFIRTKLVEGVDFGVADDRSDKATLLKPGSEKICLYLRLQPVFLPDLETLAMIPQREDHPGVFALVCYLIGYSRKREALDLIMQRGLDYRQAVYQALAVAEGRGMAVLNEPFKLGSKYIQPPNTLIKKVEKRAQVDAVLRVAGLSDIYQQDIDEVPGIDTEPKKKPIEPKSTVDEMHVDKQTGNRFVIDGTDVGKLGYEMMQILKTQYYTTGIFTKEECQLQKKRIINNVNGNPDFVKRLPEEWCDMAEKKLNKGAES